MTAKHPPVYYPVMLDLCDKAALVVGGGKVARRKVDGLLNAGAKVTGNSTGDYYYAQRGNVTISRI